MDGVGRTVEKAACYYVCSWVVAYRNSRYSTTSNYKVRGSIINTVCCQFFAKQVKYGKPPHQDHP
jgi:hypothetical protein